MKNVALMVEAEPTPEQLARGRVPRGVRCSGFTRAPAHLRSVFESFAMPDRIVIFQGPHERLARSPEQLAQMVAGTVWHEIAHYFGMNEAQVRAAERKPRAVNAQFVLLLRQAKACPPERAR